MSKRRETIVVEGSASRRCAPDLATWGAAVTGRGETEREAFAECSANLTALIRALRKAAGKGAEISAGGIDVQPEWDEKAKRRVGFVARASAGIRASLAEAAALGQVALDAGSIRLDGPAFEISDEARIRDELLADAVRAARARAEAMAKAADRRVGRALAITDRGRGASGEWSPRGSVLAVRSAQPPADAPPIEPSAERLEARVTVTFELRGKG